jgi:hypothetical protein
MTENAGMAIRGGKNSYAPRAGAGHANKGRAGRTTAASQSNERNRDVTTAISKPEQVG